MKIRENDALEPKSSKGLGFDTEQREFIKEVMYDLKKEEFLTLYLKFWENFTTEDIAKLLSLPKDNINHHIKSGLGNLRRMYQDMFPQWKENLKNRMAQL